MMTVTPDIHPILSDMDTGDPDNFSHYARTEDIVQANVEGGKITALCGYEFEPVRDPQNYPVCPRCKELVEFVVDMS